MCHMVPTSYDRNGVPQTGANHDFGIIEPEVAAEAVTSAPIAGLVRNMPNSSCSSCHKQDGTQYALYLQELLDNRQAAMQGWDDQVTTALGAAATNLGFTGSTDAQKRSNANSALNAIGKANWSSSQLAFQKAFTNQQYIESEGSWGIHNWDYARTVILKALDQAQSVTSVSVVTIKASATSVKVNKSVKHHGQGQHRGDGQRHHPEEEGQRLLGQLEDREPHRRVATPRRSRRGPPPRTTSAPSSPRPPLRWAAPARRSRWSSRSRTPCGFGREDLDARRGGSPSGEPPFLMVLPAPSRAPTRRSGPAGR